MKKTNFKKALSVFLSVLMLMSCWVFVPGEHNHVSAASTTINLSALAAIHNGSGSRADSGKIVICSDGEAGNTTVGNARFSISALPSTVTKATFYLNTGNHGGTLVSGASVKAFLIDPSKCQATSVGHAVNNIANIYGSNYNAQQGVTNAYNYYGITDSQALFTFSQSSAGQHQFDITNAVNQAKANGWSDLCFAFIMPAIYNDGNGNSWSDTHINVSGTYLQVEYEGAYGMPSATNQDGTITFNQGGTSVVNYPTQMYMDISEDLADTGYSFKFKSNINAQTIFFPVIWGGQESDKNGNFSNDLSNYNDNLKGQTTIINAFDKYGIKITSPGQYDNYSFSSNNTVLIVNSASSNIGSGVNFYLQGKPKTTGTYNYNFNSYNKNNDPMLFKSGKNTVYSSNSNYTGNVNFTITVYDKEALNSIVQKNNQIYALNQAHGDYIKVGLNDYLAQKTAAENLLKKRETTQADLNDQVTALENAIRGLKFHADNSSIRNAVAKAEAIMNETGYAKKYTEASRTALETAYNNAKNSIYYNNVPVYQITNLNDSTTWDCDDKAVADQIALNDLANALDAVTMQIQNYDVTFKFANGSSDSKTYEYGTTITVPSNSTKQPDATNHYSYTWSPAVSTTVTDNATYSEVLNTEAHDWGAGWTSVLAGDCITSGIEERKCTKCEYVERRNTGVDNTVHNYTEVFSAKAATCTEDGYTEGTYCYDCETWIAGHETIPAAHTPGAEATCTAPQTCTVCGTTIIAALGHTEVAIPAVPATCTTPGTTEGKKCSVCGTVTVAPQNTELAAHTEATREENRVNATCGADGSYVLVTYCSECKTVIKTETKIIPATGKHTWDDGVVTKAPTCITAGVRTYTCSVCNNTKNEAEAATGNHVYGDWAQYGDKHRRTCTADIACTAAEEEAHNFNGELRQMDGGNYHQYKCEKCEAYGAGSTLNIGEACFGEGITYAQIADDASQHKEICKCGREKNDGHDYDAWEADPENKDNNQGKMSRICSECSYKQTSDCTYTLTENVASSCTVQGHNTWVCNDCGNGYSEILPLDADNHEKLVKDKAVAATCTDTGLTEGEHCEACDVITVEQTEIAIDADAHTTDKTHVDGYVAPTCTTPGATGDTKYDCCNAVKVASTEIPVDATAHTGEANVIKNDKAATCTEEGYTGDTYWSCCDKLETSGEEIAIDADAHTTDETYVDGYVAPTCTTPGATGDTKHKCCNAVKVASTEIPVDATAHTGEANVVKNKANATCTSEGYTGDTYWSCCDKLETSGEEIAIDADAHTTDETYVDGYVAPTCTTPGATGDTKYKCCNAVKVTSEVIPVDANAHTGTASILKNDKEATCTEGGYTGDTYWSCCDVLATSGTATGKDADAHTGTASVLKNDKAATCTEGGYTGDTHWSCCDALATSGTATGKDATAHTGTASVLKNDKAATCTEDGYTGDTHWSCCDALATSGTATGKDATAHTGTASIVKNAKAATCTEGGYTGDTHWSCCDALATSGTATGKDATAHTGTASIVKNAKAATCTEGGYTGDTHWSCCDALATSGTATGKDATAHTGTASVVKNASKATCKADGYTGDIYWSCCDKLSAKGSTIPALEHIDKDNDNLCDYKCGTEMNTCKHEGTPKQYITNLGENGKLNTHKIKCLACGQIVKIENCDFEGSTVKVAPSCYEEGYTKYTCKICTYSFVSDFVEKTEHDFGEWESNNATCHEIQSMSRRCKNTKCLYKETVKIIDENTGKYAYGAHSLVVVPGKDATCTKAGYTSYSICIHCEEVTGSKPIPAKGHADEDGNGNCDVCDSLMGSNGVCGCFCHNDSFFGKIIFKILNFFWKLFKINANCECGVKHW